MTLLSFSRNEIKLLKGIKCRTTRRNYEFWEARYRKYREALDRGRPPNLLDGFKLGLHMYWMRPINPASYPMGVSIDWKLTPRKIGEFTDREAREEGYQIAEEFEDALFALHAKDENIEDWFYDHVWAHIEWDWHVGPCLPDQYRMLTSTMTIYMFYLDALDRSLRPASMEVE